MVDDADYVNWESSLWERNLDQGKRSNLLACPARNDDDPHVFSIEGICKHCGTTDTLELNKRLDFAPVRRYAFYRTRPN